MKIDVSRRGDFGNTRIDKITNLNRKIKDVINMNNNINKKCYDLKEDNKKDKQISQRKYWFFTFNNYVSEDLNIIDGQLGILCNKFKFQEELGENGNKHLQGAIELKKPGRWTEFDMNRKIHWEPTKFKDKAFDYCCKEESRNGLQFSKGFPLPTKVIDTLRPWQQSIVDIINGEINDRIIYWIYDPSGCNGKTQMSKYLGIKYDAVIATAGSEKDIACLLAMLKKDGRDLNTKTTFVFSYQRSTEGFISYKAIESVKDGLITSSKYESSTLIFNSPHVFIFANTEPELDKLTHDRWNIQGIEDNKLFKYIIVDDHLVRYNREDPIVFKDRIINK